MAEIGERTHGPSEANVGSFPEDSVPPRHFHIGNHIFLVVEQFSEKLYVHIRRYKKHGAQLSPSTEGVCLSVEQFLALTNPVNIPGLVVEVTETGSPLYFTAELMEDGRRVVTRHYTCRSSGEVYTRSIALNTVQWHLLFERQNEVTSTLGDLRLDAINLRREFERMFPDALVKGVDLSSRYAYRAFHHFNVILQNILYDHLLTENGFYRPLVYDDNENIAMPISLAELNKAAMDLNVVSLVSDFYRAIKGESEMTPLGLCQFLCAEYLDSVNLIALVNNARNFIINNAYI